jgi:hypothetical protein
VVHKEHHKELQVKIEVDRKVAKVKMTVKIWMTKNLMKVNKKVKITMKVLEIYHLPPKCKQNLSKQSTMNVKNMKLSNEQTMIYSEEYI